MQFEPNRCFDKISEKIGYIAAYFVFTTILFFALTFLNKLPVSWSYFHIILITFLIALSGYGLKVILR